MALLRRNIIFFNKKTAFPIGNKPPWSCSKTNFCSALLSMSSLVQKGQNLARCSASLYFPYIISILGMCLGQPCPSLLVSCVRLCLRETIERVGHCWLLRLSWMGTQRVQLKQGPSLIGSLGLSCRYKRLVFSFSCSSRPSTKYFFPQRTLFQFLCPLRPASWAGSRAESPVN